MTNQQAQILIVQGLNSINTFYSQDLLSEEIDLQVNEVISLLIRAAFYPEEKKGFGLEDIQLRVDDFQSLIVKDLELLVMPLPAYTGEIGVSCTLPTDYYHLINSRSKIAYTCNKKPKSAIVNNRQVKKEFLYDILNNSIYKTKKNSPVCDLQNNTLTIYRNSEFTIKTQLVDYVKFPIVVDSVANPTQIIQFDNDFCAMIVDTTIRRMAKYAQQDPQKIAFIQQEKIN